MALVWFYGWGRLTMCLKEIYLEERGHPDQRTGLHPRVENWSPPLATLVHRAVLQGPSGPRSLRVAGVRVG